MDGGSPLRMVSSPARAFAERLERGLPRWWPLEALARLWEARSDPARRLALPPGRRVVMVGGTTLGGAGRTPLAIAVARALHEVGEAVALVGHAHRARPPGVTEVTGRSALEEVGDDALAARAALPAAVPVVVARRRGDALRHAAGRARWLVVDGALQARPARAALSLLAAPASRPWGSGRCPPLGDLRATPSRLLAASDRVVLVGFGGSVAPCQDPPERRRSERWPGPIHPSPPVDTLRLTLTGLATRGEERLALRTLGGLRVGLAAGLARPSELLAALREQVALSVVALGGDHGFPPRVARPPDLWLASGKCAARLGGTFQGRPVYALSVEATLPAALAGALATCSDEPRGLPAWTA